MLLPHLPLSKMETLSLSITRKSPVRDKRRTTSGGVHSPSDLLCVNLCHRKRKEDDIEMLVVLYATSTTLLHQKCC